MIDLNNWSSHVIDRSTKCVGYFERTGEMSIAKDSDFQFSM